MGSTAIHIEHMSICFNMSRERVDSIKEYIIRAIKHQLFYDEFWALKDISLDIKKGEVFGLVGFNGAGKSTMLKAVAGVLKPTKGSIYVEGSIAPLIELGAGFDPELTARENVFMNGAVLGYSMTYMQKCYQEIMDFSVLLVSHSTDTIKKFCNRAAWLENGELKAIGTAEDICDQYEKK